MFYQLKWLLLTAFALASNAQAAIPTELRSYINELPQEMQKTIYQTDPQIVFTKKSKEFFGSYDYKNNKLTLNETLQNTPDLLKRTIFHEMAHLYDKHADQNIDRKKLERECQDQEKSNSDFCKTVNQKNFKFSKDIVFQSLFGIRMDHRKTIHFENLIMERSPDHYEFTNERELFAVNFEYFMLDTDYKCRRPLQYKYFYNLFSKFNPFPAVECSSSLPFIKLDLASAELIRIDATRVYRIDYLQAAAAKGDIVGGFGHSMLRVVVCAPERKIVDAECLKDTDNHLVMSFRASVSDEQISSLKGLQGKYPSNQYIMSYASVIEEYTQTQYRDLMIFPLKLSRAEIDSLLTQMSLQHWSLERKYYFASNNCASEIINLLRSTFGIEEMFLSTPVRPLAMPQWLYQVGLLNSVNEVDTVKSTEYYWQKTLDQLNPTQKIKFSKFLEFSTKKRSDLYNEAIKIKPGAKTNALIKLLEFKMHSRYGQLYYSELEKVLKEVADYDTSKLTDILGIRNSGWILVDKTNSTKKYGIPDSEELLGVKDYLKDRASNLLEQVNIITDLVKAHSDVQSKALDDLKLKKEESRMLLESFKAKKN